jgi:hypothetical protein
LLPDKSAQAKQQTNKNMKTDKNTGTKNATAQLAELNAQIEALKLQKTSLAEPMKERHAELRSELLQVETEISGLDPTWKPASLRPKADDKIIEIITTNGTSMTAESIIEAVGSLFSPWKIKNVLKKKSTGAKAIFTLADGKYSLKEAA